MVTPCGGLHRYSTVPDGGLLDYTDSGSLTGPAAGEERFYYDARERLVEHWAESGTLHDGFTTLPSFYEQRGGAWGVENGWLEETSSGTGRIVRVDVPEDLESFRFSYQSQQVLEDFDGNPTTENKYGPEYYALALMKVFQREPVAPAVVGEYEYIALAMTPNEIALREWSGDVVTDLASVAVDSVRGVGYDVTVTWDGAELTVSRGPSGGALTELFTAETTLENDSTDIGFGVGERAEYRFDEVRLSSPSLSAEEPSKLTEYTYDALGRRVAMTDYGGASARTTRYLYAGDRIIEELDGDNNLLASYVYGQYVDEVLQMRRDTSEATAGMEDHYYLHDDLYNVLALADPGGNVLERYYYGDYGAPTIADPAGEPYGDRDHSLYDNPFLFNGRQYDETTGFYYYRTRYMEPLMGRFISRDTIGLWGDANNLGNPYSYVGNNPWSRLDPFGEAEVPAYAAEWNHDYPQDVFRSIQSQIPGLDIDAPENGSWMPHAAHRSMHNKKSGDLNDAWSDWLTAYKKKNGGELPSMAELEAQRLFFASDPSSKFRDAYSIASTPTVRFNAKRSPGTKWATEIAERSEMFRNEVNSIKHWVEEGKLAAGAKTEGKLGLGKKLLIGIPIAGYYLAGKDAVAMYEQKGLKYAVEQTIVGQTPFIGWGTLAYEITAEQAAELATGWSAALEGTGYSPYVEDFDAFMSVRGHESGAGFDTLNQSFDALDNTRGTTSSHDVYRMGGYGR